MGPLDEFRGHYARATSKLLKHANVVLTIEKLRASTLKKAAMDAKETRRARRLRARISKLRGTFSPLITMENKRAGRPHRAALGTPRPPPESWPAVHHAPDLAQRGPCLG
jgi:hypothetical protein